MVSDAVTNEDVVQENWWVGVFKMLKMNWFWKEVKEIMADRWTFAKHNFLQYLVTKKTHSLNSLTTKQCYFLKMQDIFLTEQSCASHCSLSCTWRGGGMCRKNKEVLSYRNSLKVDIGTKVLVFLGWGERKKNVMLDHIWKMEKWHWEM